MSSSASPSFYGCSPIALLYVQVFLAAVGGRGQPFSISFVNNDLESLRACSPHHLFICGMVAPREAEDWTQAAAMKDI